MTDNHRFQVDLRGVIDLLSQHLYSSPDVFIRELLQNGVDAIQARRIQTTDEFDHRIEIELIEGDDGVSTLIITDNGVGLTEDEVHEFLATIGQSSKRGNLESRPGDFIGRFGIGLLSGFLVSDEIVAVTRSAKADSAAVEWRGHTNGTYEVRKLDREIPVGTQVYLRSNASSLERFRKEHIGGLLQRFAEYLPARVVFTASGESETINSTAPWDLIDRDELLAEGENAFGQKHWDAVPLHSSTGGVRGVAYILRTPAHSRMRHPHRVYLKNMLLSDRTENLLPEWAFFVQCIVNASDLRPTASRESFYEDAALDQTREELAGCLREYLKDMARQQPEKLQQLIDIHHLAIKAIAVDDDECLKLFAPWLPFETTSGRVVLQDYIRDHGSIRYVRTLDDYRQIKQVAIAESVPIVNAGYVFDAQLIERMPEVFPDVEVRPFDVEEISDRFEELTAEQRRKTAELERVADECLRPHKCVAEVCRFQPSDLPCIYVLNSEAAFLRSVEEAQEIADDAWSAILGGISKNVQNGFARLHLNYHNPVIQQLCEIKDEDARHRVIEMLYVQALLMGHFPLQKRGFNLLTNGLSGLVTWATSLHEKSVSEA